MGHIKCEIHASLGSDMFTVEVKSKDGKIYQKRSSVLHFATDPWGTKSPYETAVEALIYVDYGDVITATRGSGGVRLTDIDAAGFTGKGHQLSVKPHASLSQVKEVKVTKENVMVPPHTFSKPDPNAKKVPHRSTSVWNA